MSLSNGGVGLYAATPPLSLGRKSFSGVSAAIPHAGKDSFEHNQPLHLLCAFV